MSTRVSNSATAQLVQAATLLKITTWLIHDVGHGFIYIYYFCDILSTKGYVLFKGISPWKLQSFAVTHYFMAIHPHTLHPYVHACGIDKHNVKWQKI